MKFRCPYCRQTHGPEALAHCPHCGKAMLIPDRLLKRPLRERKKIRERIQREADRERAKIHGPKTLQQILRKPVILFGVMGILLLSGSLLVGGSRGAFQQSSLDRHNEIALKNLRNLRIALERFRKDCDRYPYPDEGLQALKFNPGLLAWGGPYISDIKSDPWRRPYGYGLDGTTVRLLSCGPDQKPHTADDILPPITPEELAAETATWQKTASPRPNAALSVVTVRGDVRYVYEEDPLPTEAEATATAPRARTRERLTCAALCVLRDALERFRRDCQRYPSTAEGLNVLITDPGIKGWRGPYVTRLKPDGWQSPYFYNFDHDELKLLSLGPDKLKGTVDDLFPLLATDSLPASGDPRSPEEKVLDDLLMLASAVQQFHADCHRYPTAEEGLSSLLANPGIPEWHGPYLKTLQPDPWQNWYLYQLLDQKALVRSNGPDGKPDTGDDVTLPIEPNKPEEPNAPPDAP